MSLLMSYKFVCDILYLYAVAISQNLYTLGVCYDIHWCCSGYRCWWTVDFIWVTSVCQSLPISLFPITQWWYQMTYACLASNGWTIIRAYSRMYLAQELSSNHLVIILGLQLELCVYLAGECCYGNRFLGFLYISVCCNSLISTRVSVINSLVLTYQSWTD